MAESTWWNITHGMAEAVDKGYKRKSRKQRQRKEVADVWRRANDFCWEMQELLGRGEYQVGPYRHFKLHDLPLRDMVIVHDWSGMYYDGTVYTDAEEEEMIRKQFNIPK